MWEKITIFAEVRALCRSRISLMLHIRWKWLAFILVRKSGKFLRYRGKQKPSFLVLSSVPFGYRLHTGVEFCLFVPGHTRASSQINATLHTFFVYASMEPWQRIILACESEGRSSAPGCWYYSYTQWWIHRFIYYWGTVNVQYKFQVYNWVNHDF